ncbi:hypothetical protein ACOSP7_015339 [Xanthoceras sorbifolium]
MPPQAWKMLDEKVMSSVELHLSGEVIYQPCGLKMKEGGYVMAHLNDFNRCISDLIRVNVKYEEDDKALLLLRSLLDSFKRFRGTLLFGKNTLKYDTVVSDIISYVKMNKASEWEA